MRGRDLGSFVSEAQREIEAEVKREPAMWLAWGGQFENQERAMARLQLVLPVALLLVSALLYASLGSASLTGLVWLTQIMKFLDFVLSRGLTLADFLYLTGLMLPSLLLITKRTSAASRASRSRRPLRAARLCTSAFIMGNYLFCVMRRGCCPTVQQVDPSQSQTEGLALSCATVQRLLS